MAKNLKLNIKNAQLAEALNLKKLQKPSAKKESKAASSETPAVERIESEVKAAPEVEARAPTREVIEEPVIEHKQAPVKPKEEEIVQKAEPAPTPKQPEAPVRRYAPGYPRPGESQDRVAESRPPREGYTRDGYQRPSTPREGGYTQRPPAPREGYTRDGFQRPTTPREGGYTQRPSAPREGGYPPREGGYTPRPSGPREGGYPPREGYAPREGGYTPRPSGPREGGYTPREGGYTPRPSGPREGGYPPREGGYTPRPSGPREGGYPPREGYAPREGGYQRPSGDGYRPPSSGQPPYQRREFTPRPGQPPYQRRESGFRNTIPLVPPKDLEKPDKRTEKPQKSFKAKEESDAKKSTRKEFLDFKPAKKLESGAFDSRDRQGLRDTDNEVWRKRKIPQKKMLVEEIDVRPKSLKVKLPIMIKDLAAEMKLKASQLIAKLFMQGVILTLNDYLDDETTVQLLGNEFDCAIQIDTTEEKRIRITDETIKQEIEKTPAEDLQLRPCIVTFMGHVDHGKTSLIDAIRKSNVAAGEAGAITQHIGAFRCHTDVGDITILDTPGHEAFSEMRSRGADVTDIVVLVIAGDEGIKTQTIEALQQAKAANVPIMVALNKCDKPGFDAETVYRQLSDHELLPEAWGGTTITVKCSATTKEGVKELLEMLALQAEVLELKANPNSRARGTVIESEMHKGLGSVATVLVQNGTLRISDAVVFDQLYGRIKTMHDQNGHDILEATPSTPVKITGLSGLPAAGSEFIVVKNEKEARELSVARIEGKKHNIALQTKKAAVEGLLQQRADNQSKKVLNLVLRADVQGSLEALKNSLMKIHSKKVEISFISIGVGEISESDIQLAAASKAMIIGFHTQIESHAEDLIKQTKVIVKTHDIIYHAVDDVKIIMRSLLDKIPQETDTGTAVVQMTFKASLLGVIAGCHVTDGNIKRNHLIRQIRDKEVIWKGTMSSLKRLKEDVREVSKGYECGILLQNNNDVKEGDILQAYEVTYLEQDL